MTQLNPPSTSLTSSPASISAPEPARWLMVLVPHVEVDLTALVRKIWTLANATGARVRFISLYENAIQELSLRRQLAGLAAMAATGGLFIETELIPGSDWVEAVRARWHAGDQVICFAEQRVGRSNRSLGDALETSLDIPVYILMGFYPQQDIQHPRWFAQISAWLGSIGIIIGFFLFQIHLDLSSANLINTLLLLCSVAIEFWMLWLWNGLFG